MLHLNEKLIAYASGQLNDDEAAEIEAHLIRYADRTIDPADAAEIERVKNEHTEVAAIINEALTGKRWFEETLAPELHPIISKAEASPQIRALVETLAKAPSSKDDVYPAVPSRMPTFYGIRGEYALAASIALALLIGGLSFTSMITDRIDSAENNQLHLEKELDEQKASQEQQLASIIAERASALADLNDVKQELQALRSERSDLKRRLAASLVELEPLTTQAKENIRLRADLDDREMQIFALTDQIADLDTSLSEAAQKIAGLETAEQTSELAIEQNRETPMPNWTKQVAGYYKLYAKQPRRHLVEVQADERKHIEKWLGEQLGRPVFIPDLSEAGMEFQGARLLAINGMPVAQLTYLDADDHPLAFCFMRNMNGETKDLELSTHEDLNLVDWRDQAYQYVVVGSTTFAVLEALAQGLDESYRDDI